MIAHSPVAGHRSNGSIDPDFSFEHAETFNGLMVTFRTSIGIPFFLELPSLLDTKLYFAKNNFIKLRQK